MGLSLKEIALKISMYPNSQIYKVRINLLENTIKTSLWSHSNWVLLTSNKFFNEIMQNFWAGEKDRKMRGKTDRGGGRWEREADGESYGRCTFE